MNIYWSQKDIPALKGLSREVREAAKRAVIGRVWKHWQAWLPFAILIAAYIVFLALAPRFPFRFPIVLVTGLVSAKVAALPFNHYLDYYLSRNEPKS
ncbi:MAG: hypothetical protein JWM68_5402 [Verrucomicrobiales bacterium]|nr:hypothetical protein [Verrucomicrobiales bacterium]